VQPAELLYHPRDGRLDRRRVADVAADPEVSRVVGRAQPGGGLRSLALVEVQDRYLRALLGEPLRGGEPDATGGARDDRDAPVESTLVNVLLLREVAPVLSASL
jgi:hypothetical protein